MTTNIFISLMIILAVLVVGIFFCFIYTIVYQKYLLNVLSGKGSGRKLWQPKIIIWIFCVLFIVASLQCGFQVVAEYGFRPEEVEDNDVSFQIYYSYADKSGKIGTPKLLGVFDSESEFVLPPEPDEYRAGYFFDGWIASGVGVFNKPYTEAVFAGFAAAGVEYAAKVEQRDDNRDYDPYNPYKELFLYTKWSERESIELNFEQTSYTIKYDEENGYTDLDFIYDTGIDSKYILKISDTDASCYIGGNYLHNPDGEYLFYFDENANHAIPHGATPHGVSIEIVPAANSRGDITIEITPPEYEAYAEYELKAGKLTLLKYSAEEVFFGSLSIQNPDIKFHLSGKVSNVIGWSTYVGREGYLFIKNHGSTDTKFRIIPLDAQVVIPNQPIMVNSTPNVHYMKFTSHVKGYYEIDNAPSGDFSVFDSEFIPQQINFMYPSNKKGIMMNAGETLYFMLNSDYYGSNFEFLIQSGEMPGMWQVNGDSDTVYRTLKVKRGEAYNLKYIDYWDNREYERTDLRVSYYGDDYYYVDIDDGIVVIPDDPGITDIYVSSGVGGHSLHMMIEN